MQAEYLHNTLIPLGLSLPFMVAGLAGSVFPAIPGVILVWIGMLLFFITDNADRLSLLFIFIQGVMALSTYAADYIITIWGVKRFKGSRVAAWGAVLGSLMIFVLGPLGLVLGPLVGAVAGDLLAGREIKQAFKSGFGSFLGFIFAMMYRIVVCGIMISWFVIRLAF